MKTHGTYGLFIGQILFPITTVTLCLMHTTQIHKSREKLLLIIILFTEALLSFFSIPSAKASGSFDEVNEEFYS